DAQLARGDDGERGHGGGAARAVPGAGDDGADAGARAGHDAVLAHGSRAAAHAPSEAREGQPAPRRVEGERLERNRAARLDRRGAWRHVAAGDLRGRRGRDAGAAGADLPGAAVGVAAAGGGHAGAVFADLARAAVVGAKANRDAWRHGGGDPGCNEQTGDCCAEQREEETNWCFHGVVAFIMLLRDLPAKVAEDFSAMEAAIGGSLGVLQFEARRVLPRRVTVNKLNYYKIAIVGFEGTIRLC